MYTFTSTACTASAIGTDCTSDGVSGASLRTTADGNDPRVLYFKAPANGPVYVAVDATNTPKNGRFALTIDAIPTPTNFTCANAKQFIFFNGKAVVDGDTHHKMTPDEFPNVKCSYSSLDGPQVYFKFDAVAGKSYKIKATNNAGYYLFLYVFGATCTESAISADCKSGGAGAFLSNSFDAPNSREINFTPATSGTYHIAIDGTLDYYNGYFTLVVAEFISPANGKCSAPEPITLTQGRAKISGTTLGMANEFGTAIDCTGSPKFDGSQAYYTLTASSGKAYKLTLSSHFESYLYLFRPTSCGSTSAMNADCGSMGAVGDLFGYVKPNSSQTYVFRPQNSGDYILTIDANNPTSAGDFILDIQEFDAPANSTACTATPLTFTKGTLTIRGSTYGAPNEFGTTSTTGINCDTTTVFDGDQVYYEFPVDASKAYVLSLSPLFSSAYMYIFQKSSCSARWAIDADCGSHGATGARVGAIYGGSMGTLSFNPLTSGTYVVAIDTSNTPGGGDFTLAIDEIAKPQNTTCATAAPLTFVKGSVTVSSSTAFARDEYSTLQCKSGTYTSAALDGPQLYWSLNLDATKNYAVTATTSISSGYLYLFDGSKPCSESSISSDCQSGGLSGFGLGTISKTSKTAYFKPTKSGPYKIAIDSYYDGGKVTLTVDEFAPAANQTCVTAQPLAFINHKATATGFTVGAQNEFGNTITCGTSKAFAGGQTYYRVAMVANRDYFINLSTDHSAVVYLFGASSACTGTAIETDCASGGITGHVSSMTAGTGGTTGFRFRAKTTGDAYIVVDSPSTGDVGRYTLAVSEIIPPTGARLVIEEINTGNIDYVALRNAGTQDVSLNGVEFLLTGGIIAKPDNRVKLPNQLLKAGDTVYLVEASSPAPGDISIGGNIPYIYNNSFVALLCQGACDAANAMNVIDAARFGTSSSPELPGGISFIGGPLSGLDSKNQDSHSFTRIGFSGKNPHFDSIDWSIQPATR